MSHLEHLKEIVFPFFLSKIELDSFKKFREDKLFHLFMKKKGIREDEKNGKVINGS